MGFRSRSCSEVLPPFACSGFGEMLLACNRTVKPSPNLSAAVCAFVSAAFAFQPRYGRRNPRNRQNFEEIEEISVFVHPLRRARLSSLLSSLAGGPRSSAYPIETKDLPYHDLTRWWASTSKPGRARELPSRHPSAVRAWCAARTSPCPGFGVPPPRSPLALRRMHPAFASTLSRWAQ